MKRRDFINLAAPFAAAVVGSAALILSERPARAQALWSDSPAYDVGLSGGGGTRTLSAHFPSAVSSDTIVYITANSTGPSADVPSSVTVTSGNSSATFTLTYGAGSATDKITVNLSANGGNDTGSDDFRYGAPLC